MDRVVSVDMFGFAMLLRYKKTTVVDTHLLETIIIKAVIISETIIEIAIIIISDSIIDNTVIVNTIVNTVVTDNNAVVNVVVNAVVTESVINKAVVDEPIVNDSIINVPPQIVVDTFSKYAIIKPIQSCGRGKREMMLLRSNRAMRLVCVRRVCSSTDTSSSPCRRREKLTAIFEITATVVIVTWITTILTNPTSRSSSFGDLGRPSSFGKLDTTMRLLSSLLGTERIDLFQNSLKKQTKHA
jgi:hypothetical protein